MNKLKYLYIVILSIIFKFNMMAMEINEQIERIFEYGEESLLLNLPTELLTYIIEQGYREDILNWNDIFEEPKINLGQMQSLAATSKAWRNFYIKTFKVLKNFKKQRFDELKEKIKEEYKGLSTEGLNKALFDILNKRNHISKEDLKIAVKLILAGANVNTTNNNGWTALILASYNGYEDIVEILIKAAAADVKAKNKFGGTALMMASYQGRKETTKLLILAEADINAIDNNGITTLMFASYAGHKDIIEILLQSGADVNAIDNNGNTALIIASEKDHKDIVKMLNNHKRQVYSRCILS